MSATRYSHANFLARAREHQRKYLLKKHGVEPSHDVRAIIPAERAMQGANFVNLPVVRDALVKQFQSPKSPLVSDMLRSQHIPFNLVLPLSGQENAPHFFSKILKLPVERVEMVRVEYAPKEARELLGDRTCFDAYAEVQVKGKGKYAVGIEVKYTEGPYGWGKTEKAEMTRESSNYRKRTNDIYRSDSFKSLCTPKQKQMWRNQLLGECILAANIGIKDYRYLLLYPGQSDYSYTMGRDYSVLIREDKADRFAMISYEDWLDEAHTSVGTIGSVDWVAYARERYLLPNDD